MIDGVDVSGCKGFYIHDRSTTNIDYWMYGQCKSSKEYGCYCRNNPNCYYKQLARKTQECESLKEEIEVLKDNFDTATRDCNELIDELKQECEELKEKLEKFYILAGEPIEYFLDHYTNLCEDFLLDDRDEDDNTIPILEQIRDRLEDKDTLEEENTRYRKALEEIEEYIKEEEWSLLDYVIRDINNIINKAKEK